MEKFSLEALLALYSIPSIGPTRMRKLISIFRTPQAVLAAGARQLMDIEGIDHKTAQKIKAGPDEGFIKKQIKWIREYEAAILTYWDDDYPETLKKIYDPPAFLFVKGQTTVLKSRCMAVVGTRTPTQYGKLITERLTNALVSNGFTITSGFARGVDTLAHKTTVENGGQTVAVLGNGIDRVYPAENIQLMEKILRSGLVISEYPMGAKPDASNFPKRNRIISGLSEGVIITEAGAKSGALISAYYALDQNREVFAVPGAITSPASAGANLLIKQGAKLVQTAEDIFEEVGGQQQLDLAEAESKREPQDLDANSRKILSVLNNEPQHIDQLAVKCELSPSETLSALLMLELRGLVKQMAGKMFVRL